MLFNSLDFTLFIPIIFILYWFATQNSLKLQNVLIVLASYVFYGWWDWRFLALIALSTLVDYSIGLKLYTITKASKRKVLLWTSVLVNIGLLAFFKYYNFFVDSWVDSWSVLGIEMERTTLNIILPVGISFYTFQTLSYTIDIYRNKLKPTTNLIQFAAFVSFFPQLVAGPIERAKNLLPQFGKQRVFDPEFAMSGFYLIIWGLFKKVVIADNCAFFVNQIFDGSTHLGSLELFLGAVLFGFQIYGDFSGYSDIAIGVARLFGFSLMTNFSFPYFSRNIAEFWRRWHISLSTWFRDYLYIPLGGSRGSLKQNIRNVCIVFLVSGFWHGANWTFIVWGSFHALLFLPLLISKKNRLHVHSTKMRMNEIFKALSCFLLVTLAWIFFRADNLSHAYQYLIAMFNFDGIGLEIFLKDAKRMLFSIIVVIGILVLIYFEWRAVQNNQKEVKLSFLSAIIVTLLIVFMGVFKNPSDFIYFQF